MDSEELKKLKKEEKSLFLDICLAVKDGRINAKRVPFEFPHGAISSSDECQKRHYNFMIAQYRRILAKTV
jgi:hypothetical protein